MPESQPKRNSWVGSRRKRIFIISTLAAGTVVFAITVWPTPYRYEKIGAFSNAYPARINRLTGTAEKLGPEGWSILQGNPKEQDFSEAERAKISVDAWELTGRKISATIHNGSNRVLSRLTVEVVVRQAPQQMSERPIAARPSTTTLSWDDVGVPYVPSNPTATAPSSWVNVDPIVSALPSNSTALAPDQRAYPIVLRRKYDIDSFWEDDYYDRARNSGTRKPLQPRKVGHIIAEDLGFDLEHGQTFSVQILDAKGHE